MKLATVNAPTILSALDYLTGHVNGVSLNLIVQQVYGDDCARDPCPLANAQQRAAKRGLQSARKAGLIAYDEGTSWPGWRLTKAGKDALHADPSPEGGKVGP